MSAEEIVRALAASNPFLPWSDRSGTVCQLCGADVDYGKSHDPGCPYRQAAEWVAANPGRGSGSCPGCGGSLTESDGTPANHFHCLKSTPLKTRTKRN